MTGKFYVIKVYKDGYNNIYTTPASDRIMAGYGVKKMGTSGLLEVFKMRKAAMKQADYRNGQ